MNRDWLERWRARVTVLVAARLTWAFAGVWLLVQAAVDRADDPEMLLDVYRTFGLSREGLADGGWWQLLSYGFVHGGWVHLGMNLLLWGLMAPGLEWMGGWRLLAATWFFGTLGGGLCHLALVPGEAEAYLLVGASGGVTAVLLWLTGVAPEAKVPMLPVRGRSLGRGLILASGLLAVLHPNLGVPGLSALGRELERLAGPALFNVSHACHFGGAVAGWLVGKWTLRPRVTLAQLQKERARREGRALEMARRRERGG